MKGDRKRILGSSAFAYKVGEMTVTNTINVCWRTATHEIGSAKLINVDKEIILTVMMYE